MRRHYVIVAMVLAALAPSLATSQTVPHAIKIQGYATDSLDNPLDDNYTMVFDLYGAEVGGTWIRRIGPMTVPVVNGVYEVTLSFTPAELDGPQRWVEISIGAETLSPRLRMTSAPYAYHADKLDGADASSLEESAEIDADIASHSTAASAHHVKYTNSQAVAAVLGADGAGSGFDADYLDGLSSGEFATSADVATLSAAIADLLAGQLSNESYGRVVLVDPNGNGDFLDPVSAMDSITDAAADNQVLVQVLPGTYVLPDGLVVKSFVDLVGSGRKTTVLQGNIGVNGQNSELRSLSVEPDLYVVLSGAGAALTDVNISKNDQDGALSLVVYSTNAALDRVALQATGSTQDVGIQVHGPSVFPLLFVTESTITADTAIEFVPTLGGAPNATILRNSTIHGDLVLHAPLPPSYPAPVAWNVYMAASQFSGDIQNSATLGPYGYITNSLTCVFSHDGNFVPRDEECQSGPAYVAAHNLKNNSVSSSKLRSNSVTTDKLLDEAVTSEKLAALDRLEFEDGSVQTTASSTVAVLRSGNALMAPGGGDVYITPECPSGFIPISGMWVGVNNENTSQLEWVSAKLSSSYGNAWRFYLHNESSRFVNLDYYVRCLKAE